MENSVVEIKQRRYMSKKKIIIAVLIAVIAIVLGWYFWYFTKTPVYSLNLARESVEKHDVVTFKKHVDVESIIGSGYDDFVDVQMNDPVIKDNPFKGFAEVMLKGLKSQIVPVLTQEIYNGVEKKSEDSNQNTKSKEAASEVKEKTGVKDLEFKSIGSATIDGNSAIVPIIFSSKDLNQDVTFDLLMKKLEDGTWQAIKINNFKEYLDLIEKNKNNKTNKN